MFSLGALGAGLGQFAEQYRQQQESALRQQQMQMQMAQYQQRMKEQQEQRQAQAGLWGALMSGAIGGDAQPIPGQTLGGQVRSGGDLGGGLRAGGALTGDPLDLIAKYESGGRNIEQGVVGPQGGYNPSVGRVTGPSSASGPWQMIDPTWRNAARAVGIDTTQYPRAITAPIELQRKAAQHLYDTEGFKPWAPYNANLRAAIGRGGEGAPPRVQPASYTQPPQDQMGPPAPPDSGAQPRVAGDVGGQAPMTSPAPGRPVPGAQRAPLLASEPLQATPAAPGYGRMTPPGQDGGGADFMAPVRREVQQGIQGVAKITPPSVYGKMGLQGLARQIEQVAPGADPAVKYMMLEEAQKLLAPDAKMQWEAYKERRSEDFQKEMATFRDNLAEGAEKRREALAEKRADALRKEGGKIMTDDDGTPYVYNEYAKKATTLTGEPYAPIGARRLGGGSGSPLTEDRSRAIKELQSQKDQQWNTENPLADADAKKRAHTQHYLEAEKELAAAKGPGGMQAETAANRVTGAANLLSGELKNMSELPAMSTASIFQGIEAIPGRHPGEAIKRTLAAAITPEDATDLVTSFQGVGRAVAALETSGAATGLVGLAESAKAYQPAATDTVGNVMRKFATLRQILERGLESASVTRGITEDRRALYEKIKKEVQESIPFTVEDVTKLRKGDGETYRQLFERTQKPKAGAGAAGAPPPGTTPSRPAAEAAIPPVPPQQAINDLRAAPSVEMQRQFDQVFGDGAAARALGK